MENGPINLHFPVRLQSDEDGSVTVTFPQVPVAITQGYDEAEALANAAGALEAALSFDIDDGMYLPRAGKPKRGQRTVHPSARARIKLARYQRLRNGTF